MFFKVMLQVDWCKTKHYQIAVLKISSRGASRKTPSQLFSEKSIWSAPELGADTTMLALSQLKEDSGKISKAKTEAVSYRQIWNENKEQGLWQHEKYMLAFQVLLGENLNMWRNAFPTPPQDLVNMNKFLKQKEQEIEFFSKWDLFTQA